MGEGKGMTGGLRILLADEDEQALRATERVLTDLGHTVTALAVSLAEVAVDAASDDPDLAIVVLHADDEHALALVEEISAYSRGPVIALVSARDAAFVVAAAERGLDAFARSDDPAEIQAAIDVAIRHHAETTGLAERVDQLEGALERRAVIERAKGILMERHSLGERDAFSLLRDHARGRSAKVVDIARAVGDGHALLPKGPRR